MAAPLASLARLGLALFVWSSALTVALSGALAAGGSNVRVMASAESESFGLTYATRASALLALAEVVLVLFAWSWTRGPRPARRAVGAWLLVVWAGLWTVNALRWTRTDPEPMALGITLGLALALACALAVARARARRP